LFPWWKIVITKIKIHCVVKLEEKDELGKLNKKLTEEASYAKELASAAAVELQNLAEEVTRLCNENAKLSR
jgi:centromeric protein E